MRLSFNPVATFTESIMSTRNSPQIGSNIVWWNAPSLSADVDGTRFVYRQLGPDTGVPVILLNHLAAELDHCLAFLEA